MWCRPMPTAKARYLGRQAGDAQPEFSDALRAKLRGYYPDQDAITIPPFESPADDFVSRILMDARWAVSELKDLEAEITKPEIRREHEDLLKSLRELESKLRSLSLDYDRLLGIQADPLGLADKIASFTAIVAAANPAIDAFPSALRAVEKQRAVMLEMAIRVLMTLKEFGIPAAQTADADFGYQSKAVEILKAIGDEVGLVRSPLVWRDIIGDAKKAAPDLQ